MQLLITEGIREKITGMVTEKEVRIEISIDNVTYVDYSILSFITTTNIWT